ICGVSCGGPSCSSGGLASESTCCSSGPNSSIILSRASTSHSVGTSGKARVAGWFGTSAFTRSNTAFGMKWLKMSIIVRRPSLELDAGLLDDLAPLLGLRAHERGELCRRLAAQPVAQVGGVLLHFLAGERRRYF